MDKERKILRFTTHARKRMKERGILEEWVRETIYNPEEVGQGEDEETIAYSEIR